MPYKDPVKARECDKKRQATPEYKAMRRAYYLKNKERFIEAAKKNHEENKERNNLQHKKNRLKKHKYYCIFEWKRHGIVDEDYDSLYQCYIEEKNCWICGHDFSKYRKNLDHDHETGEARFVCCFYCNSNLLITEGSKNGHKNKN